MSSEPLQAAPGRLRTLLTSGLRAAGTAWDWFRELGRGNDCEARGQTLLREWLSPQQLAQYDAYHYFDVTGSHSGNRYRIYFGTGTNIHELDEAGRPKTGWCFVPRDCLAAGDVMLAQKIALEANERSALAIARSFAPRWTAR